VNTSQSGSQYSSAWIGIDGDFNRTNLIQAGTSSENIDGRAKYYAWIEMLPASLVQIPLVVHPRDDVIFEIIKKSSSKWEFLASNTITNKYFARTVTYKTPGKDAEAIYERPYVSGKLSTLANTDPVTFSMLLVSTGSLANPVEHSLDASFPNAALDRIFMINRNGAAIASPSTYENKYSCFVVADGSKPPPTSSCG
jgi:hypothetical protein